MSTATTDAAAPAETDEHPRINDRQMRQMHALLHDHGWVDRADILDLLSTMVGRDIASRKDLTVVEAAEVIKTLDAEPRHMTPAILTRLRAPFPDGHIGKLPRSTCRDCSDVAKRYQACERHQWVNDCPVCHGRHSSAMIHLDYVGHADVTDRLLDVDPAYTWRPFTGDELMGIPPAFRDAGLWGWLTVAGVTRPCFGDAQGKTGANAVKEAIGDLLRNGSMRYGVALELWAKGDRDWMHEGGATTEGTGAETAGDPSSPTTPQLLAELDHWARKVGKTRAEISEKWRGEHGGVPVEALDGLAPLTLAPFVEQVRAFVRQQEQSAPTQT